MIVQESRSLSRVGTVIIDVHNDTTVDGVTKKS